MSPYGVIYKITNQVNGKMYVGQTVQPIAKRLYMHSKQTVCRYLYRAIQKYGLNNFSIEQIDTAYTKAELDEKEILWITWLNTIRPNGYNIKSGGGGGGYWS